MSKRVIVPGKGPVCPRCKRPMQIREHRAVTERELRRPFYYSRWYRCMHGDCRTTLVMPDEHRVFKKQPVPRVSDDPWQQDIACIDLNNPPWGKT